MIDDFDGRMIGLDGEVRHYPRWLFVRLDAMHRAFKRNEGIPLLERDDASGLWRMLPALRSFRDLWEGPAFRLAASARAIDPGFYSGRSHDSGYRSLWDLILGGIDPTRRDIRACEADLEHTRTSRELTRQLVADVRRRRRAA